MTWRDAVGVSLALASICAASWAVNAFAWLAWVVLAGALLFVLLGSFWVLVIEARTARGKAVSHPYPAPGVGSRLPSGGPVHTRGLTRPTRARNRTLPGPARPRPPVSRGQWFD